MKSGNDSLADKVIGQIEREQATSVKPTRPDQWGIDDTGFPWPNPVNAQAVAARIFFKHGKNNGIYNIFKIGDDIFIGKKKVLQNKPTLLSYYEKPNIVLWANENPDYQDVEKVWMQIKKVISSEWPIIWAIIRDVAPEYNREYIKVTDNIIWGKNEADIIDNRKE